MTKEELKELRSYYMNVLSEPMLKRDVRLAVKFELILVNRELDKAIQESEE